MYLKYTSFSSVGTVDDNTIPISDHKSYDNRDRILTKHNLVWGVYEQN